MKRKAQKTEHVYLESQWTHHRGPIGHVEKEKGAYAKPFVNVSRYNGIVLRRKLRLASYVGAPILRKQIHFENNPHQ